MGVHNTPEVYAEVKRLLGIPEDEPIFILRGQDDLAMHTVTRYRNTADSIEDNSVKPDQDWLDGMDGVIAKFAEFRNANPDRMHVPN
jgi:hypothetical protein